MKISGTRGTSQGMISVVISAITAGVLMMESRRRRRVASSLETEIGLKAKAIEAR